MKKYVDDAMRKTSYGQRMRASAWVPALCLALGGCRLLGTEVDALTASKAQDVASVAGWTRIATTQSYLVVANVLPGEEMYTKAEVASEHPIEGELCIIGLGAPVGPLIRHVEAHVYDRLTGLPLTGVTPQITLVDRGTGRHTNVPPTLMQDLDIGALDIHFGNNVAIPNNSDLRLTVTIGNEEATFDGHLD